MDSVPGTVLINKPKSFYPLRHQHGSRPWLPMLSVVVVGAGLSGLVAALSCLESGVPASRIAIYEGRGRVGGRVLSTEGGIDLGGAWVWNGAGQTEVLALAHRMGVESFSQPSEGHSIVDNGPSSTPSATGAMDGPKMRFRGGAAAIAEAVATHLREAGVAIHLETRVTGIEPHADGSLEVRAVSEGGCEPVTAKTVLLAIPPRLALPPFLDIPWPSAFARDLSSTATWMGGTAKILLEYPTPFWRQRGLSGEGMARSRHPVAIHQLYDASSPDGPYALCGFNFAEQDHSFRSKTNPEIGAWAVQQVTRMFGVDVEPTAITVQRWGSEELTGGDGTHADGGRGHGARGPDIGAEEAVRNVWVCSAEASQTHSGVMEGAVRAGMRAGRMAVQRINERNG